MRLLQVVKVQGGRFCKITLSVAFFCAAAAFSASADTLTWTGRGDGSSWSDAGNWSSDGANTIPANGDSIVIDIGSTPVKMVNDIENLTLASFNATGNNDTVLTLGGNKITMTGSTASTVPTLWYNFCSIELNLDLALSGNKGCFDFHGYSTVIYGNITAPSGSELHLRGRSSRADKETGLVNNYAFVNIYGDIGGEGIVLYLSFGINGSAPNVYYYGKVTCQTLFLGCNSGSPSHIAHFMKSGNDIKEIVGVRIYTFYFEVNDALTEDTVYNITNKNHYVDSGGICFKAGSHQILDRLEGAPADSNAKLRYQYISAGSTGNTTAAPTTDGCTLELRGSKSAVTYACLRDAVDVIWNPKGDYIQDFRDRPHQTSGSILVKRGTVRTSGTNSFLNATAASVEAGATLEIASTNYVAFPSLLTLSLGENARLRIADADSEAFTAGRTVARLAAGAKISVAANGTVNLGRLYVDGAEIAAGSYTSVAWIDSEGGGTVNVAGAATGSDVYWTGGDGAWGTAANWLAGAVPAASATAILQADGMQGFTATFDAATDTLPKKTIVKGLGSSTATLEISGELELLKNQNFLTVSSGAKLSVPSGAKLINSNATECLVVASGGTAEISGTGRMTGGHSLYLRKGGGQLLFKDNAVLEDSTKTTAIYLGSGETVFSDSSTIDFKNASYIFVTPDAKDQGVSRLVFKDSAGLGGAVTQWDNIRVGATNSGTGDPSGNGEVEFLSDRTHRKIGTLYIGQPCGNGKVTFGAGHLEIGNRGISIGRSGGGLYGKASNSGGVGYMVVTGGIVYISSSMGVSEGYLRGLNVGEASTFGEGSTWSGDVYTPWRGTYLQTGGVLTNANATCVGGQRSFGNLRVTGGIFRQTTASQPFMVGIRGGSGEVHFDGGEVTMECDVYAGGIFTNAIPHYVKNGKFTDDPLTKYGWSVDVHGGTGLFSVSNATVLLKKDLNLGWDGTGIVERVGSGGSFTINGNVTMSNTTAIASASILRFVLDENGIAPIQVGGTVDAQAGSKFEVNLSAYTGRKSKFKLLGATALEGDYSDVSVTVAEGGKIKPSNVTVAKESDGLYLRVLKSLTISFR